MSFPNLFFLVVAAMAVLVMAAIAWQEHVKTRDLSSYLQRLQDSPVSNVKVWVEYRTYYDALAGVVAESEAWLFAKIGDERRVCLAMEDATVKELLARLTSAGITISDSPAKQPNALHRA